MAGRDIQVSTHWPPATKQIQRAQESRHKLTHLYHGQHQTNTMGQSLWGLKSDLKPELKGALCTNGKTKLRKADICPKPHTVCQCMRRQNSCPQGTCPIPPQGAIRHCLHGKIGCPRHPVPSATQVGQGWQPGVNLAGSWTRKITGE